MIKIEITVEGVDVDATALQQAIGAWFRREGPGLSTAAHVAVEAVRAAERDPGLGSIVAAVEAVEAAASSVVEAVAPRRRRGQ